MVGAQGLRDADWNGSSDPYCASRRSSLGALLAQVVTVQGRGQSTFKTPVVKSNKSPEWNHTSRVSDMHDGDQLHFEVFDHDKVGKHEKLGYSFIGRLPLKAPVDLAASCWPYEAGRRCRMSPAR